MVDLELPVNKLIKNMVNNENTSIIEKAKQALLNFFKKEKEIEKAGQTIVAEAEKKTSEKKIATLKETINKL